MKIITQLTGTAADAAWEDTRGPVQSVCDQSAPGLLRKVTLGHSGLVISRGEARVGIPLAALLDLAEQHNPALAAPKAIAPKMEI